MEPISEIRSALAKKAKEEYEKNIGPLNVKYPMGCFDYIAGEWLLTCWKDGDFKNHVVVFENRETIVSKE